MKKKLLILAIVALAVMAPAFAVSSVKSGSSETLNLSFVKNAVNLIVGIFAGGFCLLKAALDIFHAVRNSSEDQNGLKKAIGGFVLNAAILGGFMFVINYVFGAMGSKLGTDGSMELKTGADASAADSFYGALSGALVSVGL